MPRSVEDYLRCRRTRNRHAHGFRLSPRDGQTKCAEDLDENRLHPFQPARRPRHDACVVSIQHPPNTMQRTFQCRFRADLRRLLLKMSKICEYIRVLAEEDVEQQRGKHASLTKPLCHLEPLRAFAAITPHACSHPIVELADYFYNPRRYSEASEHLSKKCAIA